METIRLEPKQIVSAVAAAGRSPLISSHLAALSELHGAITTCLDALEVPWRTGGSNYDSNTDEERGIAVIIGGTRTELGQERVSNEAVATASELTITPPNTDGGFQYLIVVRARWLSESHVSMEFGGRGDALDKSARWTVEAEQLAVSPNEVEIATKTLRHFIALVQAVTDTILADRVKGRGRLE